MKRLQYLSYLKLNAILVTCTNAQSCQHNLRVKRTAPPYNIFSYVWKCLINWTHFNRILTRPILIPKLFVRFIILHLDDYSQHTLFFLLIYLTFCVFSTTLDWKSAHEIDELVTPYGHVARWFSVRILSWTDTQATKHKISWNSSIGYNSKTIPRSHNHNLQSHSLIYRSIYTTLWFGCVMNASAKMLRWAGYTFAATTWWWQRWWGGCISSVEDWWSLTKFH